MSIFKKAAVSLLLASFSAFLQANDATENSVVVKSECLPADAARVDVTTGKVLCCCQTMMGTCCNFVSFCGGIVPGCFCTGNAVEYPD